MGKFWTKKAKRNAKIIAVVSIIVVVWGALTDWRFFSIGPGNVGFSATGRNGVTGAAISNTDISWVLNGLPKGEDKTVPANYVTLASGSSLADLAVKVNATSSATYDLYLVATATNAVSPWRTFASSCVLLDPDNENIIDFFAGSTVGSILYQHDFTPIVAANFSNTVNLPADNLYNCDAVGNFSALIGINASDVGYCAYKAQFDISVGDTTQLYWIFNFNSTDIAITDLSISASHWTRMNSKINTTAIGFMSGYLGEQDIVNLTWDATIADTIKCTNVNVFYGTTDQILAGTATTLANII